MARTNRSSNKAMEEPRTALRFARHDAEPWWRRHDAHIGWLIWIALTLVMIGIELPGNRKSVTRAYATAGHGWLHGEDLYNGRGNGFLYLPITGVMFVPLSALPGPAVEIAWRLFTIGCFAAALRLASRLIERSTGVPCFATMSGMAAVLGFPAVRNGQATLPMAAALMLSIVAAVDRRSVVAAVAATVALFLKPLALPVVAVLAVCRPRMIPSLACGVAILVVAPYAIADTGWVNRQYVGFLDVLRISQRLQDSGNWATFFGMVKLFGCPAPANVRTLVQFAAALAVAFGCREALRRLDPATATLHIYGLAMTTMLLFSPRSENNTYACLIPAIVFMMAAAMAARPFRWLAIAVCWTAVIVMTSSYELGRVLAPGMKAVWLPPLVTTLLTPWFVWQLLSDFRAAATPVATATPETLAFPALPTRPAAAPSKAA